MFLGTGTNALQEVSLKWKKIQIKTEHTFLLLLKFGSHVLYILQMHKLLWFILVYFMVCEFLGTNFQACLHNSEGWQS